jgi:Zn-dependent protease with chaperone function
MVFNLYYGKRSQMAKKDKIIFKNISPRTWEHPADRAALVALKQLPGLDLVLQSILSLISDRSLRLIALASSVRVTPNQFSGIYRLHQEACSILDAPYMPDLYISQNPFLNAGAIGVDKPFIMLNSSLLDKFSDEEIQSVIGHEIGHCLSGHALYSTLLILLVQISSSLFQIPIAQIAFYAIIAALYEWYRKAELSSDRAGLLVVQDPDVSYHLLMKLAGGGNTSQMNIDEFFKQAQDYESGGDIVDSVHKLLNLMFQTHPFPVLRLTELKVWIDKGEYQKILDGDYKKRDQETKEDLFENFQKAQDQYKEDMGRSKDPLSSSVNDMMKGVDQATKQIGKFFEDMFKGIQDQGKDKPKEPKGE